MGKKKKIIRPLPGYLLVKPIEDKTSNSGLVMPTSEKQRHAYGEVVAQGNEYTSDYGVTKQCPVAVGWTIIFDSMAGQEIRQGSEKFYLMHFNSVLGYFDEIEKPDPPEEEPEEVPEEENGKKEKREKREEKSLSV